MKKAKITAVCGMVTALSIVIMLASTLLPVLMYILPVITSLGVLFISKFSNNKWAFGVYFATAVLSLVLLADKKTALTYTIFFGYYPMIKYAYEKLPRILSWIIKFITFNSAVVIIGYLSMWFLGVSGEEYSEFGKLTIPLLMTLANMTFILYDLAITKNGVLVEWCVRKLKQKMQIK